MIEETRKDHFMLTLEKAQTGELVFKANELIEAGYKITDNLSIVGYTHRGSGRIEACGKCPTNSILALDGKK